MNWNCTLTDERFSDILDRLLLPEEIAAFTAHVAGCEACARLAQVSGVVARIQQLPLIDEPPFLAARIIAATRGTPAKESARKRWFSWSPAAWQMRFAMGAVTVAATFLIIFHAVSSGTPGKLQFSPAGFFHNANRHAHLTYARGVKFVNDLRVVYVIESKLSSQPQQPAAEPAPAPERRPDSEALPKTQSAPPVSRWRFRDVPQLAMLMMSDESQNVLEATPRSLP